MLFTASSCVCMTTFEACSSIIFSGKKYHFWLLGVWPYRYAYDIPLVTLILNIYGFVGLVPFFSFLAKVSFLAFFKCRKGCGHIDMLLMFPS